MVSESPLISVVVPTRNRSHLLHHQVKAILGQQATFCFELIVVDNGSTDSTADLLDHIRSKDPRLRVISATDMYDAAYARNIGADSAKGPFLAFVDDDDLVAPGWMSALVSSLSDHPLVAPRIDYTLLNSNKVIDGWPLTQATGLAKVNGVIACTGHFGVHATLWAQLGGQRTGFLVGEDMEFSVRANQTLGISPHYEPAAIYHRRLPSTIAGCFRQGRRDGRGRVQWILDVGRRWPNSTELAAALSAYWWIASRAPLAALGHRRYLWALHLGDRIGRIEQSVRAGVLLP